MAEKTVQIVKRLFEKAKADKKDPYISLLEFRNTPLECGFSPSQLLNSRRLRSILPSTGVQLLPKLVDKAKVKQELHKRQEKQKHYYDAGARPLKEVKVGETVRLKDRNGIWQPAVVTTKHDERSYVVETESGTNYRRNRRDLQKTNENSKFSLGNDFHPFLSEPEITSNDHYLSLNPHHLCQSKLVLVIVVHLVLVHRILILVSHSHTLLVLDVQLNLTQKFQCELCYLIN